MGCDQKLFFFGMFHTQLTLVVADFAEFHSGCVFFLVTKLNCRNEFLLLFSSSRKSQYLFALELRCMKKEGWGS